MIRDLKSVTLVCKSWHAAAYPLLYRDVHLREVGQILSFASTLRSAPQTFSPYVRSVMVTCFIPQRWTRVTRQSLTSILQQCPNLNAFVFRPVYHERAYSPSTPLPVLYRNLSPLTIPHNVEHLGLFDERHLYAASWQDFCTSFSSLALMLSWCSHLTSLSISSRSLPETDDTLTLHFPRLETLSIWSYGSGEGASKNLPLLWEIPKLASLRFRPALGCVGDLGVRLASFCARYAGTLRELDFGGDILCSLTLSSLGHQLHAASLCPHLEHLILCISGASHFPRPVVPREEVWAVVKASSIWDMPLALVEVTIKPDEDRESCPLGDLVRGSAWKRVRFLEIALLTWIPDLPYLFPVSDEALVEPRVMDCYGLKIEESADCLALVDENWGRPSGSATTDVEDGESHDGSDSNTSDSSYQYESDVSEDFVTDEGESDVESEELEDLTEEQALAVYAGIVDA
ncbi:hypothetical protein PsYK624_014640 [Phanerochaete sordida]|uniref:F-box domain-containing protein n=1 Tax=Phanerochaete sordida TaxID=48140 RepID=A0A9P3FZW6_9APHY|nr:hypothetical protein PsYK624_014640 [Phanerochaete sordida]